MMRMAYFGTKLLIKDKHLYWENGEPFFLLADTNWYGLTNRCSTADFKRILKDRKEKGFTAIQVVVGTPPETTIFDKNAKSTNGQFIFKKDYSINQAYFDDIDEKIKLIITHKLVPVLYGSWGHYIDQTGTEPMKQMWSEIVKRYSDIPVIYSLCGEADLQLPSTNVSFLKKVLNKLPLVKRVAKKVDSLMRGTTSSGRLSKWQEVGNHLKEMNATGHPVTVHLQSARLSTSAFNDPSFITLNGFQSGHSMDGFETMKRLFANAKSSDRPVINLEPMYEGILDQFDTRFQNYSFYNSLFAGACGHGYGAHGLWQMAKSDNFLKHWGNSTWQKALDYPGGRSIGKAKEYFIQNNINWQQITDNSSVTIETNDGNLKPLVGSVDKQIFLYIPYPQHISSININEQIKNVQIYNAVTFKKLQDSSTLDLSFMQKSNLELFVSINIV